MSIYSVVVEVEYTADDEFNLTTFINHLIQFKDTKVKIRRIYPLKKE